jgi:hypothetical protein
MGEKFEEFLDRAAQPIGLYSGTNLRALWNGVPHEEGPEHPEDKDWADSEPDPNAP